MKIGILSKRTHMFAGKLKDFLERKGHNVKIYTLENLCINESLFENDFYILKSKKIFFIYAGYYLVANNIPVFPDPDIIYRQRNRIEAHYLMKQANLLVPDFYLGKIEALKKQLKESDFPLILKLLMSAGSRGIKVINFIEDLDSDNNEAIYLEKYIKGTHYTVYFIRDEICTLEKPPLCYEHVDMKLVPTTDDIKEIILKWKNYFNPNLLFGHLDIVREDSTNKLFVVDPGSFPQFSNWKCNDDPVSKIGNIIIKQIKKL